MNQDKLREQVKIAKIYNPEWRYKTFAECLDMAEHSFYNWLNGFYDLGQQKVIELSSIVEDLLC